MLYSPYYTCMQHFVPLRDRIDNSRQSIDENNESYDGGREEPCGVETNPCEVDTYLFTKVAPKGWSMLGNKAQMSVRVSPSLSLLFELIHACTCIRRV